MKINRALILAVGAITLAFLSSCGYLNPNRNKIKLPGQRINVLSDAAKINLNSQVCSSAIPDKRFTLVAEKKVNKASSLGLNTQPILADGQVVVLNLKGELIAYDEDLTKILWRKQLGRNHDQITSGQLLADGSTIYATNGTNEIYAFAAVDGQSKWSSKLSDITRSAPLVFEDMIFVQTIHNHLYALDAASGKILWHHIEDSGEVSNLASFAPVMIDQYVVIQVASKNLLFFEAASGNVAGSIPLLKEHYIPLVGNADANQLNFFQHDGRKVYSFAAGGKLVAINLHDKSSAWQYPIYPRTKFVSDEGALYLISNQQELASFDKGTGKILWSIALSQCFGEKQKLFMHSPIIDRDTILAVSNDGAIVAFNKHTGSPLWKFNSESRSVASNIIVTAEHLYLLSNNGKLYKYKK